jgi:hypothetical protein
MRGKDFRGRQREERERVRESEKGEEFLALQSRSEGKKRERGERRERRRKIRRVFSKRFPNELSLK